MITFTKEQIIASAHARIEFAEMMLAGELEPLKESTWSIELELARIALASLEAEPVAWRYRFVHAPKSEEHGSPFTTDWVLTHCEDDCNPSDCFERQPLYTAPPAPVSVPDAMDDQGGVCCEVSYADGWNACRAAMLQCAEPVTTAYKLPEGWVAVPVEPTEDMIVNGFESEPDKFFSDAEVWEAYDAMSGCQQAAHRAKLCWAAMIAAAPQKEVK